MSDRKKKVFFVLSCARSGSTSLARILDTAENGVCAVEPVPNLNRETRDMMEGRIKDPMAVLENTVIPRVREQLEGVDVYGEKNVTYGPFIPYLYDALGCKFVFLKRDGRDVVRSLINWHEKKFGSIYRECKESGRLSPTAVSAAANLPIHLDTSDYARPRPSKEDPLHSDWEKLTRLEMCSYYWSTINELYLNQLMALPDNAWTTLDYTAPGCEEIERVAEFLGLRGFDRETVRAMLQQKINSLEDRSVSSQDAYPEWKNWDGGKRRSFDHIAAKTMYRLGYYREGREWKPKDYGQWWQNHRGGLDWYTWMYNGRLKMHKDLVGWVEARESQGDKITSIADFGCGLGVGYCDDFAGKEYIGIDLSAHNIQWCQKNRKNPKHKYCCRDFIAEPLKQKVDLAFSSGTIDNGYDINASLESMVRSSGKWIYLTFYRGWFPDLEEHIYTWSDEHLCFYSDASAGRIRQTLLNLGCSSIIIEPVATGREDIPFETRVIAHV